jgi:hypothetical protein
MSELQNDVVDTDLTQAGLNETENLDEPQGSDLAPDSEATHEEKPQADVENENVQKVINKKHYEKMEAERKAADLQEELERYKQQEQQQKVEQYSSSPQAPDLFDDDYEQKMVEYSRQIEEQAMFKAQQNLQQQAYQQQQQQEQLARQQELQQKATAYLEKGKEYGMTQQELEAAGNTLISYGASEQLQEAILTDGDGPLITKYLAANPTDIEALTSGNPYLAGAKLAEVKLKAEALKPKTTEAPEPTKRLEGGAVKNEDAQFNHVKSDNFS